MRKILTYSCSVFEYRGQIIEEIVNQIGLQEIEIDSVLETHEQKSQVQPIGISDPENELLELLTETMQSYISMVTDAALTAAPW